MNNGAMLSYFDIVMATYERPSLAEIGQSRNSTTDWFAAILGGRIQPQ